MKNKKYQINTNKKVYETLEITLKNYGEIHVIDGGFNVYVTFTCSKKWDCLFRHDMNLLMNFIDLEWEEV